MDWNVAQLSERQVYRLLVNTIVPRPIALVTTVDAQGRVNTAPFSFFNVMGSEPPVVALGIEGSAQAPDGLKDTARNILAQQEFVVNLVDHRLARAMNLCALELPASAQEHETARLDLAPSARVRPPRLAGSPVQLECRLHTPLAIGPRRHIVIGEILHIHCRDGLVDEQLNVDIDGLDVIGRLHGADWYVGVGERVQVPRATPQDR